MSSQSILQLFCQWATWWGPSWKDSSMGGKLGGKAGVTEQATCWRWVTRTKRVPHQVILIDLWEPQERQQEGTDSRSVTWTMGWVSQCTELKGWMAALDSIPAQSYNELHMTRPHLYVSKVCWRPRRLRHFWKWDCGLSVCQDLLVDLFLCLRCGLGTIVSSESFSHCERNHPQV